jgi:5-methylcytosine-specific restriction endonuclease McrA
VTEWEKIRAAVLHRDGKCMNCGVTLGLAPHHIKSRGSGGTDEMENIITLCMVCHNAAQEGWLAVGHRGPRSVSKKKRHNILEGDRLKIHLRGLIGE